MLHVYIKTIINALCNFWLQLLISVCYMRTVQTFNSCTSRPYICQCLVVQTPMDDMSKTEANHINDSRSLQIKATFSCGVWDVWLHPCLGNSVQIGRPVVYYARAAHAFSEGIKCRHGISGLSHTAFALSLQWSFRRPIRRRYSTYV